jgi:hypothetical protein
MAQTRRALHETDTTPEPAPVAAPGPARPAMRRVFVLGTLLIVFNAYFGTYAYVVTQALIWTQTSLLRGPVVVLFFLALINLLFVRFARRYALTRAEMLALYSMLCVSTCAAGYGFVQILVNQMAGPFYYASGSNHWKDRLWPYINPWLTPREPEALRGFFRGNASLYDPLVLRAWAVPVLAWSLFIFAVFWVLLCLTTLFRRAWVDEERLVFPLAPVPLMIAEHTEPGSLWRSRGLWIGFVIAGLLESANYVSYLYPSLPSIPIKPIGPNRLDLVMTTFPWSHAGMVALAFYPFVLGIAYLIPVDVSFSCWSLYIAVKIANIMSAVLGFSEGGGSGMANRAPYTREQGIGAFVGIAILAAWTARRSLAKAWKEARRPTGSDKDELMSYRTAIIGGALGTLFLAGFLVEAGLSPAVASLFVFVYLACGLALARIVSEAGAGWAMGPQWTNTSFVAESFGTAGMPAKQVIVLYGYTLWTSDMRDNFMPQQTHSMKLAQSAHVSPRTFLWPLLWAGAFGTLCAFWAHLHIYYMFGAASAKVRLALQGNAISPFQQATSHVLSPTHTDFEGIMGACWGFVIVALMTVLRQRFLWWPFHPLGYALATTQSMDYMWFPFFLAWLAKVLTLRYGGIQAYRRAIPFCLGLILGDYVVPTLWGAYGMVSNTQQYMVFPH